MFNLSVALARSLHDHTGQTRPCQVEAQETEGRSTDVDFGEWLQEVTFHGEVWMCDQFTLRRGQGIVSFQYATGMCFSWRMWVALNRTGQLQMFEVTMTSGLPACTQPPTFSGEDTLAY